MQNNPTQYKQAIKNYKDRSDLIPLLQSVQNEFSYIPKEIITEISEATGAPLSDIYGVITFYRQFQLTKPGKFTIKVCDGTACHVNNSTKVLDTLRDLLNVAPGETTKDNMFTLSIVSCLGCCALAPAMMIEKNVYGHLTQGSIKEIINRYNCAS